MDAKASHLVRFSFEKLNGLMPPRATILILDS